MDTLLIDLFFGAIGLHTLYFEFDFDFLYSYILFFFGCFYIETVNIKIFIILLVIYSLLFLRFSSMERSLSGESSNVITTNICFGV